MISIITMRIITGGFTYLPSPNRGPLPQAVVSRVCADARLRSAARASARAARVSLVVSQAAIHVSELNYQQASGAYI